MRVGVQERATCARSVASRSNASTALRKRKCAIAFATAILIESGLAFLGLGDPNVMSWGFQIGAGRTVLRSAWWICTFPGVAILLTVLAINLVGEGLNDALNPRLRSA